MRTPASGQGACHTHHELNPLVTWSYVASHGPGFSQVVADARRVAGRANTKPQTARLQASFAIADSVVTRQTPDPSLAYSPDLQPQTRVHPRRRIAGAVAVGAVIAAILALTLDPFQLPPPGIRIWEWCVRCGRGWGVDFVLNLLLFLPLGIVLRLARARLADTLLGAAALSFLIEVLQLIIPGRITSVDDVVANTLGAIAGYALAGHLRGILAPDARQAAWWLSAAGTWVIVLMWGTLWMFEPAPTPHVYWGQFAPLLGQFGFFDGTVLEASVGEQPIRNGRLSNTDAVRSELRRDSITVHATARGGGSAHLLAPIVSIFDGQHNEILLLGRSRGASLTFRVRSRATTFGLRTPEVTAWTAFPRGPGSDTVDVRITGIVDRYALTVTSKFDSTCATRTIQFRPTYGWALLVPFENLIGRQAAKFTTIWMALLFAPLGYYAAAALVRRRGALHRLLAIAFVGAVFGLGLLAIPLLHDLTAGTREEWTGAVVGFVTGAVLSCLALVASRDRRSEKYN